MNIIRLILIIGLVYISYQQKKKTDRNIMLIMTGLLGLCMLLSKVEGYCTIPASELNTDIPSGALINNQSDPVVWGSSERNACADEQCLMTSDNFKFNE